MKAVGARMLISPPKYVQGAGAMHDLGEHAARLGENALVLADPSVWGFVDTAVTDSLAAARVTLTKEVFGGLCTRKEIDRVAAATAAGADVIVGIGGGTAIDTAKAVGHALGAAALTGPTAHADVPACTDRVEQAGIDVTDSVRDACTRGVVSDLQGCVSGLTAAGVPGGAAGGACREPRTSRPRSGTRAAGRCRPAGRRCFPRRRSAGPRSR